jgi:acyl-homoserine-lactone acylase
MHSTPLLITAALALAGCASLGTQDSRTATIQRTAHGVAHISAPDMHTLAYGVAYAHAQDNVCQTAQQLVTIRGERSRTFGGVASGQLGLRLLSNEQIDLFIALHMDDAALAKAWSAAGSDAQAMAQGYVEGYNRFLADNGNKLPAPCKGQPWVQPMTVAQLRRLNELSAVQAGLVAFADGLLLAQPPQNKATGALPAPALAARFDLEQGLADLRAAGLLDSPFGSNAWAFGKDTSAGGRGLLLGNPHFPWVGVNRFWQMHLTIPGRLDVMGASIGHTAVVQIGFNKDVAWSHTVSTGRRFTLHELALVPGDPTSYLVDGKPEKMRSRSVSAMVKGADGLFTVKQQTVWSTRWGPMLVVPRLGLVWNNERAYALQDANTGNVRSLATWLGFATARNVGDMQKAMANLGVPWVNTIAADRDGNAMYADVSVVPDVDAAQIERCAPSTAAAALRNSASIFVLDGSKSTCDWKRDASSPVPGITPMQRMPLVVRSDWVHNSNDSFFYTHPQQRFDAISPLVGDDRVRSARTRSGLIEVPDLVARGLVTAEAVQRQLFANRNLMARLVLPDLLAACSTGAPTAQAKDGCAALRGWDRASDTDSRGAHLFREFWRASQAVPKIWRVPYDKTLPITTPAGLNMEDAAVAAKVWENLAGAVQKVRAAGLALDATLGSVQRGVITEEAINLHGGEGFEGVLNYLGSQTSPGIGNQGFRIDYGTSYVQTVGFDNRGPVAQALLTYGQSSDPASPHAADQLRLYARKVWPRLPFHADEVERERVGPVLKLTRP